ncbi:MAG: DUF4373 domain-containing protein [Oscillospiraceae bacterium]
MGRPRKQTADWFPHYVADSRTKFILEDGWGNNGYAFWFKLLELLCKSDGHFYDCSIPANRKYIAALTKVDEQTITEMMKTLAELGKIDKELWEKRQVIWCQTLIDNLAMMYSKRTVSAPEKPLLEEFTERISTGNDVSDTENSTIAPPNIKEQEITQEVSEEKEEKPKGKPRKKKAETEPGKVKYAEFVSMTEEEYEKLVATHGKEKTARMIEVLDNYKGSKGTTYKNDYRAILNWVVDRVNEELKKGVGSYGGFGTDRQDTTAGSTGFKASGGFKK